MRHSIILIYVKVNNILKSFFSHLKLFKYNIRKINLIIKFI